MHPYEEDVFFDYCLTIAEEFDARLGRISLFAPHGLTTGTANEALLRDFLSRHMPGRMAVGQGFIHSIQEKRNVSRQCDILIYDRHQFVPVYSDGPVVVVQPEAASVVIEVKTQFNKSDILGALENIASVKRLTRTPVGIVFAFGSPHATTVIKHLKASAKRYDSNGGPDAIFLTDKGIVILCWRVAGHEDNAHDKSNSINYEAWRAKSGRNGVTEKGIVIACLLFLVFDAVGGLGYDRYRASSLLAQTLQIYAEKINGEFTIGSTASE